MEEQEGLEHVDATNVSECGALLWRNGLVRGKDWVPDKKKCPLKMNEVILAVCENDKKACGTSDEKKPKDFSNKQRGTGSYGV